jgi:hypothetical protein
MIKINSSLKLENLIQFVPNPSDALSEVSLLIYLPFRCSEKHANLKQIIYKVSSSNFILYCNFEIDKMISLDQFKCKIGKYDLTCELNGNDIGFRIECLPDFLLYEAFYNNDTLPY